MEEKIVNPDVAAYPEAPKLDLSKIKNLDALEAKDKSFVKEIEKTIEKNAKLNAAKKFSFIEEYDLQLPSNGIFYQDEEDENIRNGIVTVRPFSITEEEIMANQAYINNGSMFRRVFNSVITSNFDARKLCSYDSLYLMYALRKLSYGDDYTFKVKCPSETCNKEFETEINISDVPFEELDKELKPVRKIKLPVSKYTVTMKVNRLEDEEELEKMKKMTVNKDTLESILGLVIKTIEILDENGDPLNPKDWKEFYSVLPAMDRVRISKEFSNDGKSPLITITCPKCGEEFSISMPFQSDFFRASN